MIGKWLYMVEGEYGKNAEIILQVGDYYLIRLRANDGCPGMCQLIAIDDLRDREDYHVAIFDTEADMDAWIKFMDIVEETGNKKVVDIKSRSREE